MGSSGTGRFSDYPGTSGGAPSGGGNECERAVPAVDLEDVANCDYYLTHHAVPPAGTQVLLREQLYHGRLAVEVDSGELLGLLPTKLNYLRQCMSQGYSYQGQITASGVTPLPSVVVDLGPV